MSERIGKDSAILEPHIPHGGDAVKVYAFLKGMTCSLCTQKEMGPPEILKWAENNLEARYQPWNIADTIQFGGASRSPSPCNQYPDNRQHWFLVSMPI